MNIFKVNVGLSSYTYPIVKIIIAIIIIALLITRSSYIHINDKTASMVIVIVSFIIGCMSIFSIYISFAEIVYINDNREIANFKDKDISSMKSCIYTIEEVVDLVRNNDIIDIIIKCENNIVRIGSSSNYNKSNGIFYDKKYYIDKNNYDTIEQFITALKNTIRYKSHIDVVSIEGVYPKR